MVSRRAWRPPRPLPGLFESAAPDADTAVCVHSDVICVCMPRVAFHIASRRRESGADSTHKRAARAHFIKPHMQFLARVLLARETHFSIARNVCKIQLRREKKMRPAGKTRRYTQVWLACVQYLRYVDTSLSHFYATGISKCIIASRDSVGRKLGNTSARFYFVSRTL